MPVLWLAVAPPASAESERHSDHEEHSSSEAHAGHEDHHHASSDHLRGLIEEISVTARKKSSAEAVQDVPVSVSAFSGDKVEAMFAVNLTDVGLHTPNANLAPMATARAVANFVIRGMGTVGQSIPSADPAVGVVMDGISYGTIYGVVTDLFDLEAIEVLRGPQGTLFGRNATAGVVSMRSTRPGEEFEGKLRATLGSHRNQGLAATFGGPLSDEWGAKLAVLYEGRDGYWKNRNLGGRQGSTRSLLVRPALTWRRDLFDAGLILEYGRMAGDGVGVRAFEYAGEPVLDPYASRDSVQHLKGDDDLEWINAVLEANLELWDGELTTVLGYRDLKQRFSADIAGYLENWAVFADGTRLDSDQISLEVRWGGNPIGGVSLTAGLYLFEQEYTYAERRILLAVTDRRGSSNLEHGTQGVFAQADFGLGDRLTLTLGGRYTWEDKDAEIGLIGDPGATGDCATRGPPFETGEPRLRDCRPVLVDGESWSNFTPRVGLAWDWSDDLLAFAGYSRGFRSGGYNVRFSDLSYVGSAPQSAPGPYDEEVVDAFEIGLKSTLLDGHARLNVSAFHNEYDDLQRTVFDQSGVQEILNAASATIRGLEVEGMLALAERWVFEASAGWLDASYDDFEAVTSTTGKSASSLGFAMAPEFTASLAATYDMHLPGGGALIWRLSWSYVSELWTDDRNTIEAEEYRLLDASVTFLDEPGRWKLALFGRNLTDEIYFHFGSAALQHRFFWLTPPRTWGVELTWEL
ncbi:MAG: TonB-dependent receptor [Proteobacteria bacterium]|nr:TonB-dependent receptor [Pseudomonadota bacterium]